MTHTLETTAIARVVARALRLNEDLAEAIGLGHDTGHPPFGHAGEEALDECLRERFGLGFRHNEQSLRIAESLNLTWEVRDGILKHTGPEEPETQEGKIVRIVDRVAYINHDIDDSIRFGILAPEDLPKDEIALLGDTGARRIDTLVHDLVEASAAAGDIAQSDEVGEAMLSLRSFMFERVYLGPQTREHERAHGHRRDLRRARRSRGRGAGDRRVHRRRHRPLRARVRGAALMARIKDESVEAVKAAANIVDLVEARTRLRKVGGRYTGLCPFHEEDAVVLRLARPRHVPLLRRRRRRCDLLVRETENLDFVGDRVAGGPLSRSDRVRRVVAARRRAAPSPRAPARLLEQAASFYERVLWDSETGAGAREYLASAASRRRRVASSGSASRRAARRGPQGARQGLHLGARGGRSRHPSRRLLPAPADVPARDARGRVIGFQARKLHDDPLRGPSTRPRAISSTSRTSSTASTSRAARSRAGPPSSSRKHRCDRARAGRPQRPVASMGTALTERQLRELVRLTQRVFLCFDSDAAGEERRSAGWSSRSSRDSTCAWSRFPQARIPRTIPTVSSGDSRPPSPTRCIGSARARSRARTNSTRTCGCRTS